jgi:NADP-dependent 3-hydroxy acid dehydrogenase YdfG
MDLHDRVIIVTGASSGIGLAAARAFAQAGSRVVLAARRGDILRRVAAELGGPKRALAIPVDVRDEHAVHAMVHQATEAFGRVDVLVNNAGLGLYGAMADLSTDQFRLVMEVNLYGALYAVQAVVPSMRRAGGGIILNVSSILGKQAIPLSGGYVASKFALTALSASLRMELARDKIRVITVFPGVTATNFAVNALNAQIRPPSHGLARPIPPERVAAAMVRAARRGGPPELYITLLDRLFVTACIFLPGMAEWVLGHFMQLPFPQKVVSRRQGEGQR